jgi:hypothetical protein
MLTTQPAAPADLRGTRAARLEICPPQRSRSHWLQRVQAWLCAGWPLPTRDADDSGEAPAVLEQARLDFLDALADLHGPHAATLRDQIHGARSLRELWHRRTEVFSLVALQLDQLEADERLAELNRHFPTRSPRSGFGALAPTPNMWP